MLDVIEAYLTIHSIDPSPSQAFRNLELIDVVSMLGDIPTRLGEAVILIGTERRLSEIFKVEIELINELIAVLESTYQFLAMQEPAISLYDRPSVVHATRFLIKANRLNVG